MIEPPFLPNTMFAVGRPLFLFTEIEIMSKDNDVIDVTDLTNEEFVEHMRELDRQSRCPCVGCEKCAVRMQRHECEDYQRWVRRYVING